MPRAFVEVAAGGQLMAPRSMLVMQAEYTHDTATFVMDTQMAPLVREGDPLQITWGYEHETQSFYGYLHHAEPYYEGNTEWIKFVCLGATFPLRQGTQRVWQKQTADMMVREIVNEFSLSADVEPDATVWPFMSVSGTCWQALVELARKVGYTLAGNGTEVRFVSHSLAIQRSAPAAPLLALGDSLVNFRPVVGATTDGGDKLVRIGFGMDPRSGTLFSATDDGGDLPSMGQAKQAPAFSALMTDVVADTPGEVAAKLGAATRTNRFDYQATAEARGHPQITQASVVYITGVGADFEGHWFVHQVEHEIRAREYTVYLQLGRDARGPLAAMATARIQPLRSDPYGVLSSAAPPSILVNGVWRSGWARRAS